MSQQKTAALIPAAQETDSHSVLARSPERAADATSNGSPFNSPAENAQTRDIELRGDAASQTLTVIRKLAQALLSPIRQARVASELAEHRDNTTHSLNDLSKLLSEWRLPSPPANPFARELSLDDSLLRYELAWIHLACLQHCPSSSIEHLAQTAQRFEEMLDHKFLIVGWRASPFTGLVQAIEIARAAGTINETDSDSAIRGAFASSCRNDAWRILRVTVQHIAASCGFPR